MNADLKPLKKLAVARVPIRHWPDAILVALKAQWSSKLAKSFNETPNLRPPGHPYIYFGTTIWIGANWAAYPSFTLKKTPL